MKTMKGIFPALLTPFKESGEVNYEILKRHVDHNIKKGVNGFYSCGSTAEVFLLDRDERKRVLEAVLEESNNRSTVIAHIGSISQDEAIDLARHAETSGADAISSVPPFYYGFSFDEIKAYYYAIVEATSLPMIIYNVPILSGVSLTMDKLEEFFSDDRFIGMKHTSSDFYSLNSFKKAFPDKIIYNGYDEMFLSGIAMGADGGIGSTYNVMAEKFIDLIDLYEEGKMDEALKLQTSINNLIDILIDIGVIPGLKAILKMRGFDFGPARKPFKDVSSKEKELLEDTIEGFIL